MIHPPPIFCAIDTDDLDHALALAKTVSPVTKGLKLGLEFFNAHGPDGIEKIQKTSPEASLFVDLKFHDIPNTAAAAVRALSYRIRPAYLNVHSAGGVEMMKAAKEACCPGTRLLAVTILTSLSQIDLHRMKIQGSMADHVMDLAKMAKEAGLDGVVCSAHEISILRQALGPDFVLMVPGIRPEGSAAADQKRIMTPRQAVDKGATHLVIGRPITGHADPAAAAKSILDSIQ